MLKTLMAQTLSTRDFKWVGNLSTTRKVISHKIIQVYRLIKRTLCFYSVQKVDEANSSLNSQPSTLYSTKRYTRVEGENSLFARGREGQKSLSVESRMGATFYPSPYMKQNSTLYTLQEAEGWNTLFPTLCRKQRVEVSVQICVENRMKAPCFLLCTLLFVGGRTNELSTLYSLQQVYYCPCKMLTGRTLYSSLCMNDKGRALYSLTLCRTQKVGTSLGGLSTLDICRKQKGSMVLLSLCRKLDLVMVKYKRRHPAF